MAHITAAIASISQQWGERAVWLCGGGSTSGRDVHDVVAQLSMALSMCLDCSIGDRIGLLGLNTPEYLAAFLAAGDAGATPCPLNWRWSPTELAAALNLVKPRVVFVDGACLKLLQDTCVRPNCPPFARVMLTALHEITARPQGGPVLQQPHLPGMHSMADLVQEQSSVEQNQPRLQLKQLPDGAGLICFTSGTTSAPKGAVLSHAALVHQAMAKLAVVGYNRSDTYLHLAPLCHIGGINSALAMLLAGAQQVFLPRYSAAETVQLVLRHQVTALIAVPTMMEDLVHAAAAASAASAASTAAAAGVPGPCFPSLLRVLVGGGGMRPELVPLVRRLFPNAVISSAYGMTEAASSITFMVPAIMQGEEQGSLDTSSSSGVGHISSDCALGGVCVGLPAPGVQIAIAAEDDASPSGGSGVGGSSSSTEAGPRVGEVLTRGPHVMSGYWEDPEQTMKALLPGGWLHTGDLGWLDSSGRLWLLGRVKDTVKSGGENVHAREVEAALEGHPAIAVAAVVGLPHNRLEEMVAAAVVLRPGWQLKDEGTTAVGCSGSAAGSGLLPGQQQQAVTSSQLQEHCRAVGLTAYKLPRRLVALPELPRNSNGKVVKPAVRQLMLSSYPRSPM